ncbi:MAG: hypothetical protein ACXVXP_01065 [Mycobacteriaceae bacterium]
MNFALSLDDDAVVAAARLWVINPVAVRTATDAAEASLRDDQYRGTTQLSEGLWWIVVPPVVVCFEIDPVGRRVKITDVLPAATA